MVGRRDVLGWIGVGALAPAFSFSAKAAGLEDRLGAEIALFAAGAVVTATPWGFTIPDIADSGYSVPVSFAATGPGRSPMTAIRLIAPDNPVPRVLDLTFGDLGVTAFRSRIRLARSQTVVALARLADGRILREDRKVDVLVGGCGSDL